MSDSDTAPSDASPQPSVLVQPAAVTLFDHETKTGRRVALSDCISPEAGPLPALLFAQVLLLSDMARALQSMAETIKASASGVEDHKASAQTTLDEVMGRVFSVMSSMPGMDPTVIERMTTALRPPPNGGTPG